jgi:Protein of unknown function (DUF3606)
MRTLPENNRYVIDVSKSWHVSWWAAELGVSEGRLVEAVAMVGNKARDVDDFLSRHKVPRARPRARGVATSRHFLRPTPRQGSIRRQGDA